MLLKSGYILFRKLDINRRFVRMKRAVLNTVYLEIILFIFKVDCNLDTYFNRRSEQKFVNSKIDDGKLNDDEEEIAAPHVTTITDPVEIREIMARPRTPEGYVIDGFEPLPYPSDFTFYDVNGDGVITIEEMIYMTGEAENMELAFEATDKNRDGHVTKSEFIENPWGVDVT